MNISDVLNTTSGTLTETENSGGRDDESWWDTYYAPIPDWVNYTVGIALIILTYVGVHGNLLTIYIFITLVNNLLKEHILSLNLT